MGLAWTIGGCAADDSEQELEGSTEELSLSQGAYDWAWDSSTTCTVGGVTMHCCPGGWLMRGAHLKDNVFFCQAYSGGGLSARFLDTATRRNGMHSCPWGSVMAGFHKDRDILLCQTPLAPHVVTSEFVDGNPPTLDSYPMHVCAGNDTGMSGIHVNYNFFNCAR